MRSSPEFKPQLPRVEKGQSKDTPAMTERVQATVSVAQDDMARRDLAAQEAMAFWAMWMFIAAMMTFAVTSMGTVLIWNQVRLTRRAVEDSGKAAAEMAESNRLARADHLPFMDVLNTNADLGDGEAPGMNLGFVNKGLGRARNVRVYSACSLEGPPDLSNAKEIKSLPTLGPQEHVGFHSNHVLSREDRIRLREATKKPGFEMRVWTRIEYENMLGDPGVAYFGAVARPPNIVHEEEPLAAGESSQDPC